LMSHQVEVLSPSMVKLINTSKDGAFTVSHTIYTADDKNLVIDEVEVNLNEDGARVYLLTNSALKNSGLNDNAEVKDGNLRFFQDDLSLNVSSNVGFKQMSVGYVGVSDGYQQLKSRNILTAYNLALDGNVSGVGEVNIPRKKGTYKFYIVYSFSNGAENKESKGFKNDYLLAQKETYEKRWSDYFNSLKQPKNNDDAHLFHRSMYVLKTHEDKLNPGAMIASLSVPWGEEMVHHKDYEYGGYHLIWPRDLFHVSLAALYSGDKELPLRALKYLKSIQYKKGVWNYGDRIIPKNGAFPQNVWTNKEEYWGGLQIDQVAYPIHLFWHLYKAAGENEKSDLLKEFNSMLIDALSFIVRYGPWSGQERWEENFGISPSSFAAATAALLIGSEIFKNDSYQGIAHQWLYRPNDNIHDWTFTTNGFYGDGQYYLRVGGCEDFLSRWNPNASQRCIVANSWQPVDQRELLDQGFLKLSLYGLVSAKDWRIQTSLKKIKDNIMVRTPKGIGVYRYSFDAYGEENKGRLWPILNGEQGRFFIEEANLSSGRKKSQLMSKAHEMKNTFHGFKNQGHLIPEQIFEDSGLGTGGATPLAWSHAEYIKLMWSIDQSSNIANPF